MESATLDSLEATQLRECWAVVFVKAASAGEAINKARSRVWS